MGGSSKKQTVGYKYYLGMHMVMCHGPVDLVTRISVDGKVAWSGSSSGGTINVNAPELFGGEEREGGISGAVDVAMGHPGQGRNAYLQSQLGADIPAFRRVMALILRQCYLGNNPYLKRWAIRARRIAVRQDGLEQWYLARANVGNDMNPAHIIREVLTDPDWGMGYPEEDMDEAAFTAAADTLHAEGMGMSILWDKQQNLDDFLAIVLRHIDGSLYVDRVTGRFVLKLARGGYNVDSLLTLDESNVDRVTDFKRPTVAELTNQVTVVFWDKSTGKNNSVTVQDIALAASQGATVGTTVQYPGFTNGDMGTRAAARDLKALSTPLASAVLYVNRTAAVLNIGDVFKFSWEEYGITQIVFRVTNIELGELTNNLVKLTVVEDVFALSAAIYAAPPPSEWVSPISDPVPAAYRLLSNVPYYLLARELGDSAAQALPTTASYLMIAAASPTGSAISAQVHVDEGAGYSQQAVMNFCPTAQLSASYGHGATSLAITGGRDLDLVSPGDLVVMGYGALDTFEVCEVVSITDTALVVRRGMLDTTPGPLASGLRTMFVGRGEYAADLPVEYAAGENINVRLLTTTGNGTLPIGSAPTDSITVAGRQARPYPPGRLRLNGAAYPATITGQLLIEWAHRDRLQQTAESLVNQDAANVGPEAGTAYTLRLYDQGGTLRRTMTGMTDTSFRWASEGIDCNLMGTERTGIAWTQSALLGGETAANASNMRDNNQATGTWTTAAASWVQADLGSALSIGAVGVAAGVFGGPGSSSAALNGCTIQYSADGVTGWTTVATVANVTDTNGTNVFEFTPVTARYWRLNKGSQIGVSEFRLYATAGLNTSVRMELESTRDGLTSLFRHNYTVAR
ncbi:putative virion structural protein [Xanthomonas phage vB_Xar_IVIA-DoCa5]|uniref:Virion structural protein n=1 Tax=Xanthomonas phage vB_Xar_IVIA-DoCa5 TaxID=2975532 RepID=A0A9X9JMS8_9CAUD|nr:putative virion structural protein [Xanthomonas phage vB_Xar_IVIA-DoCa5]UYA98701.1 putative virion structural protein [Xanthomonas phage vB_Xar_IVIA-DoCa5]